MIVCEAWTEHVPQCRSLDLRQAAGRDGGTYQLHGEPITQAELARFLGESFGVSLRYRSMRVDEYLSACEERLGPILGPVIAGIYQGIRGGAYDQPSDFEDVAGRPHVRWADYFRALSKAA